MGILQKLQEEDPIAVVEPEVSILYEQPYMLIDPGISRQLDRIEQKLDELLSVENRESQG